MRLTDIRAAQQLSCEVKLGVSIESDLGGGCCYHGRQAEVTQMT